MQRRGKGNTNAKMAQEPAMPGAEPTPNGYQVGVEMDQMTFHLGASYAF